MIRPFLGQANGVIVLLALGLGYIVCSLAKKEEGVFRAIGYIIGISIIVISGVLIISKVLWTAGICTRTKISDIVTPEQQMPMSRQMPMVRPGLPRK